MRNVSVTICLLISIWTIFATRSCDLNVPLSEWMVLAGVRCQSVETWILSSLFASHSKVLPTAQNQCKSDLFGWISILWGTQNYKCITRLHQTFPSVDYLPLCYLTAADAAATLQGNLFCCLNLKKDHCCNYFHVLSNVMISYEWWKYRVIYLVFWTQVSDFKSVLSELSGALYVTCMRHTGVMCHRSHSKTIRLC